jgi:phage baseplate assembly protein gpV
MSQEKGISPEEKLRKAVRSMVADMIPVQTLQCEVKSVDADKRTCVVIDSHDLLWEDVLLGVAEGEGNWNKPSVGSMVNISIIENIDGAAFVSMFSEVDEVYLNCKDGAKFALTSDGKVKANGDKWTMVKGDELKSVMDTNKQFITALESTINVVVNEPGNGAPSAFQAALISALSGVSWGDHSQITNDKVLHGNG